MAGQAALTLTLRILLPVSSRSERDKSMKSSFVSETVKWLGCQYASLCRALVIRTRALTILALVADDETRELALKDAAHERSQLAPLALTQRQSPLVDLRVGYLVVFAARRRRRRRRGSGRRGVRLVSALVFLRRRTSSHGHCREDSAFPAVLWAQSRRSLGRLGVVRSLAERSRGGVPRRHGRTMRVVVRRHFEDLFDELPFICQSVSIRR